MLRPVHTVIPQELLALSVSLYSTPPARLSLKGQGMSLRTGEQTQGHSDLGTRASTPRPGSFLLLLALSWAGDSSDTSSCERQQLEEAVRLPGPPGPPPIQL